jgi:hypothetical protein
VSAIEARIAEWTRLPADHGEAIQVLRYENGQKCVRAAGRVAGLRAGAVAVARGVACRAVPRSHAQPALAPPCTPARSTTQPIHPPTTQPPNPRARTRYEAHWDWFDDPQHAANKEENRAATVLLYLGEVLEGGETSLPLAVPIDEARQAQANPSARVVVPRGGGGGGGGAARAGGAGGARCRAAAQPASSRSEQRVPSLCAPRRLPHATRHAAGPCAAKGAIAVVPKRGDALLFWGMNINGTQVERAALHASCPTTKVRAACVRRITVGGVSLWGRAALCSGWRASTRHARRLPPPAGAAGRQMDGHQVDPQQVSGARPTRLAARGVARRWRTLQPCVAAPRSPRDTPACVCTPGRTGAAATTR